MDDLQRFCIRMLGDGPAARSAAETARAAGGEDRLAGLRAAVSACRRSDAEATPAATAAQDGLAAAVARELATASGRLTTSQREVLALRDLMGLSYEELAAVTGGAPDEVAPVVAGARLALRAALRGSDMGEPGCPEHDRALRTIAARQDAEPVPAADEAWLIEHLGVCGECARAHAAMLEAAACYRAWGTGAPAGAAS